LKIVTCCLYSNFVSIENFVHFSQCVKIEFFLLVDAKKKRKKNQFVKK